MLGIIHVDLHKNCIKETRLSQIRHEKNSNFLEHDVILILTYLQIFRKSVQPQFSWQSKKNGLDILRMDAKKSVEILTNTCQYMASYTRRLERYTRNVYLTVNGIQILPQDNFCLLSGNTRNLGFYVLTRVCLFILLSWQFKENYYSSNKSYETYFTDTGLINSNT